MLRKTVALNIGLNNNPYNYDEIVQILSDVRDVQIIGHKLSNGVYMDNIEPTLIIELSLDMTVSKIIAFVEMLCTAFTQECIPAVNDQFEILVYEPNFQGEEYKFNSEYFLTL